MSVLDRVSEPFVSIAVSLHGNQLVWKTVFSIFSNADGSDECAVRSVRYVCTGMALDSFNRYEPGY